MHDDDELMVLRDRIAALEAALDRIGDDASNGACCVVKTVPISNYPTNAVGYFPVQAQVPSGVEAEGNAGTLAATGDLFYAFNLGTKAPPPMLPLLVYEAGGRWVFTYNG